MKRIASFVALGLVGLGLLLSSAYAGNQSCITSGVLVPADNNSHIDNFVVTTTSTTSIYSTGTLGTGYSAGGGCHINRDSTFILDYSLASSPPYNTHSASLSGLAAGTYYIGQGCNGVTGESYDIETYLSW